MDIENYILEMMELGEKLQNHPNIHLVNFNIVEQNAPESIDELSQKLPFSLPPIVIEFYKTVHSIQIRWIRKDNPDYEPDMYDTEGWFNPIEGDGLIYDGIINMLPFEDVFFGEWNVLKNLAEVEESINFNNKQITYKEFYSHIYPFDIWNDIQSSAFYVDKNTADFLVLTTFFHSEDYHQSIITDFESYLEMILHTNGMHDGKYKYYKNYNSEYKVIKTPRSFWTKNNVIDLDSLPETF
ncbi:hypothetical protein [uncultured Microscilla sp.]|uniref:hypothetical protein n=1 Tax=uncultured Microscilla sp. TaxID=432653 RepID=UPI002630757B|nr:hypothetical protein [uncultured Microscilla sp.]